MGKRQKAKKRRSNHLLNLSNRRLTWLDKSSKSQTLSGFFYILIFHLGPFKKMAKAFFKISHSSLVSASSFLNRRISTPGSFNLPLVVKAYWVFSSYCFLHLLSRFSWIPWFRATSETGIPLSVISFTASTLNSLSIFFFYSWHISMVK
jgi:hypothetical protein